MVIKDETLIPYFSDMSRNRWPIISVGMSSALPRSGIGLGPGGRGRFLAFGYRRGRNKLMINGARTKQRTKGHASWPDTMLDVERIVIGMADSGCFE